MRLTYSKIVVCAVFSAMISAPAATRAQTPEASALTNAEVKALLVQALRDNGCRMTEEQAEITLPALGLEKGPTGAVVEDMLAADEAVLQGDVLVLTDQTDCAAPPQTADPRAVLIQTFENNACVLDEPQAKAAFEAAGLNPRLLDDLAEAMFEAGEMVEAEGRRKARLLIGPVCGPQAKGETDADTNAAVQVDGVSANAAALLTALQENDCRLSERRAKDATDLEEEALVAALLELLQSGHATMDDNDVVASGVGACPVFERAVAPQEHVVRQAVIQALENAECAMRGRDLSSAVRELVGRGMAREHSENVFVDMLAAGELEFDVPSERVTLTVGAVCGPEASEDTDAADADVDAADADAADTNADAAASHAALDLTDAFRRRDLVRTFERAGGVIRADDLPAATRHTYAASAPLAGVLESLIADGLLREENGAYILTNGEVRP